MGIGKTFSNIGSGIGKSIGGYFIGSGKSFLSKIIEFWKTNMKRY
jgi:hypothetical protein